MSNHGKGRPTRPQAVPSTELALLDEVQRISVPPNQQGWVCPKCGIAIGRDRIIALNRPHHLREALNECLKCWACGFVWSPRNEAYVLRR